MNGSFFVVGWVGRAGRFDVLGVHCVLRAERFVLLGIRCVLRAICCVVSWKRCVGVVMLFPIGFWHAKNLPPSYLSFKRH